MKNKIKLLIILLTCFLFLGNVKAYDENTKFISDEAGTVGDPIKYGTGEEKKYDASIYYVTDTSTNKNYYSYCLDPGLNAAKKTLKVDHLLMYSISTTPSQDYGILAILKNGASEYKNGTDKEEYEATLIALRMFVNGILNWRYIINNNTYTPSLLKTLYEWVKEDKEFTKLYKEYNTAAPKPEYILTSNNYKYSEIKDYNFGIKSSVAKKAKELVKQGLTASVSYLKGEVKTPTVSTAIKGMVDLKNDEESITKLVVISMTPENFGND